MALDVGTEAVPGFPPVRRTDPLRVTLLVVIAIALLVSAGTTGWLARGGGGATVSDSSVDAGFARDMSTHHTQAVTMAGYARDNTTDRAIRTLAFDIELAQDQQIGIMGGWLDSWRLSRASSRPLMQWMGGMTMGSASTGSTGAPDDGSNTSLMPGMATSNEMTRLETMTGKAMDVYFLQLMVRHHQGGTAMAQYAVAHARMSYVQRLAQQIVTNQGNEIQVMTAMLADRGAKPL